MKKILVFLLTILLFPGLFNLDPERVYGAETKDNETITTIWNYELSRANASDYDELQSFGLVPYAGTSGDWLLICLKRDGKTVDYGQYLNALDEYLNENPVLKPTDYQRIGLVKACLDADEAWIEKVIDEQTGKSGIMSLIYGLILMNSRDYDTDSKALETVKELISMQLPDGGFAIAGNTGDSDVTAMALQALSPYYEEYSENIETALNFLSRIQRDSGGFQSFGTETVESSAQVLMALCALNIDYKSDVRFIKNDKNVLDAIMEYQRDDGGFAHIPDGESNPAATIQVLYSLIGLEIFEENGGWFFDFTKELKADEDLSAQTGIKPGESVSQSLTGTQIKIIILAAIGTVWVVSVLFLIIRKKINIKKFLVITVFAGALATAAFLAKIESKDEYYSSLETGNTVTYVEIIGPKGCIVAKKEILVAENESAFMQLKKLAAGENISLEYSGSELLGNIYVKSIDGIEEFDYGSMSGWKYSVNGEFPGVSCGSVNLTDGDYVIWVYSTGEDEQ